MKLAGIMLDHLKAFAEKSKDNILRKYLKGPILGGFGPLSPLLGSLYKMCIKKN